MARILVVEDDPLNIKLFSVILARKGGHEVIIAHDADDAVKHGVSGEIDLIIMDISLQNWTYAGKDVNGIDLTKIIKGSNLTTKPQILLATAHAMKNDRENLLVESGADDYFSKPILDYALFLEKITSILEIQMKAGLKENG